MSTTPATPGPIPAALPKPDHFADASKMVEPAPRTLPAPPPGRRWHREDWTQDMLPDGWRPHLQNESDAPGDQRLNGQGRWKELTGDVTGPTLEWHSHRRTRRPLPTEASAEPPKAIPLSEALEMREQQEHIKAARAQPADDGPAWIPHDGGPCPLKDEEVKEWEWKLRDGQTVRGHFEPSKRIWSHAHKNAADIIAYRVWKWEPGLTPAKEGQP